MCYDVPMRTTLDIQEEILQALKRAALQQGISIKKMVNSTLRKGLSDGLGKTVHAHPYRCPTFSMGQTMDPNGMDKALSLADSLDEEEVARKLRMRK